MVMKTIPTLHPILRTTPHGMTKKKRNEIYNLMMATRKDNKDKEANGEDSITRMMADMFTTDFVVEERPDDID